jgi:PKD repeat protein
VALTVASGALLLGRVSPAAAADFTAMPNPALAGQQVVLHTDAVGAVAWDFDWDGSFRADATGATALNTWTAPGPRSVAMEVSGGAPTVETVDVRQLSFGWSPSAPLTLQSVTFFPTTSGIAFDQPVWDLDGDGVFEGAGTTAVRSFGSPGRRTVRLRVLASGGFVTATRTLPIGNRPPRAALEFFPSRPEAGQLVRFASLSRDPDGTIAREAWDLDGDGRFDDGTGPAGSRRFKAAGTKTVRLRATDSSDASSTAVARVVVHRRTARLLSPFPIVRVSGLFARRRTRITLLAIRVPRGSRVTVRCHGRSCPYRGRSFRPRHHTARLRSLERWLRVGTRIELLVRKRGTVGKYTSLRIRPGRPPSRRDLCVKPHAHRPSRCPS